jgi:hypothetical protein
MERVSGSIPSGTKVIHVCDREGDMYELLGIALWFNTPQLAAEYWGCGGFVPPHMQRFQGEIFNTPELAPGILYFIP